MFGLWEKVGWFKKKKKGRKKEVRALLYPGVLLESKCGRLACLMMMVVVVFFGCGVGYYST